MHPSAYENLARVQDRLWWHVARRKLVRSMLRDVSLPAGSAALDVGCGPGGNLEFLAEFSSRTYGMDLSAPALRTAHARYPAAKLICGDAQRLSDCFRPESFDLITVFHVLYHEWVRDDHDVVRQLAELLKPGGVAVITEPASRLLYRKLDKVTMGRRRYRMREARTLVADARLEWVRGTCFNSVCMPVALALSLLERMLPFGARTSTTRETRMPPGPINELMKIALAGERSLIRLFGTMPLGVSILFVARKPSDAHTPRSAAFQSRAPHAGFSRTHVPAAVSSTQRSGRGRRFEPRPEPTTK